MLDSLLIAVLLFTFVCAKDALAKNKAAVNNTDVFIIFVFN
jgi:hypothetical protein